MTVAELIHALSLIPNPEEVVVWAEGCDCISPVEDLEEGTDGTITLTVNPRW